MIPNEATQMARASATETERPVVEQTRVDGCLSYLVYDPKTCEAAVIDPRIDSVDAIIARIRESGLKLKLAIDTHAHADHVSGVARLSRETGAEAVVSSEVAFTARRVGDGDRVALGRYTIEVLATPGHTEESISLCVGNAVFTGDALLIGGAGRTDFQNGSPETLFRTFQKKLRKLSEGTVVYPGHDYKGRTHSTIGDELRANPLFAETSEVALVARLSASKKPEPPNMRLTLAANRAGAGLETVDLDGAALKARIDSGESLTLIDVRSPAEFAASRMRGARNVPLEGVAAAAPGIDTSRPLVLMCEKGVRSRLAAGAFAGRPNVLLLTGGLAAWRAAGLPTEGSGGGVWPLERQVRLVAGVFVLAGSILGLAVHPGFFAIPIFFGAGLTFSGLTGWCGMGLLLAKLPWNRRAMRGSAPARGPGGGHAVDGGAHCAAESKGGCAA